MQIGWKRGIERVDAVLLGKWKVQNRLPCMMIWQVFCGVSARLRDDTNSCASLDIAQRCSTDITIILGGKLVDACQHHYGSCVAAVGGLGQ